MALSQETALFALARTKDPAFAAQLVDSFGNKATRATQGPWTVEPLVVFPPQWVLAKQKSSALIAAYAAANCDDPTTQEQIWKTTKRATVRQAIASSKHLDETLRQQFLVEAKEQVDYALVAALRKYHRENNAADITALAIAALQDSSSLERNLPRNAFEHPRITTADVDQLVLADAQHGDASLAEKVVRWRITGDCGWNSQAPSRCSLDTATLISFFTDAQRRDIALAMIPNLDPPTPLGAADARALVDAVEIPPTVQNRHWVREDSMAFTSEGIDVLLGSPSWLSLVAMNELNDAQFAQAIKYLDFSEDHHEWIARDLATSRERLAVLTTIIPEGYYLGSHLEQFLRSLTDPADPLIEALAPHTHELIMLLTGNLSISNDERAVLGLDAALRLIAANPERINSWDMGRRLCFNTGELPDDYITGLLLHCPGAGYYVTRVGHEPLATQVFEILEAQFGDELELGLDLLENSEASLQAICNAGKTLRSAR